MSEGIGFTERIARSVCKRLAVAFEGCHGSLETREGRKAHPFTRLIVIPASTWIWQQALKEGLLEIFADAGAAVSTPTCGACFGGHMGILGRNEVCLSTSNRNFVGRMGDPTAQSYLANPAVAAASAIKGAIAAPDEVL